MANFARLSAIAHTHHPIAAPLSGETVDALLDVFAPREWHGRVVDFGCGAGVWLARLLASHPNVNALGVDRSRFALDAARVAVVDVADRVVLYQGDAGDVAGDYAGAFCVGATHAFGGLDGTLAALARGERAILGEGFWEVPSGDAALRALDAEPGDMLNLDALRAAIEAAGFDIAREYVSTPVDWDAYETAWCDTLEQWGIAHPNDPDAADARELASEHRSQWLEGYRGVLGFATFVLGYAVAR